MRYQLGCDLSYRIKSETLFIFNVEVAELVRHKDLREMLTIKPDLQRRRYTVPDNKNRYTGVLAPPGDLSLSYSAEVDLQVHRADPATVDEMPLPTLPLDILPFLLPSRFVSSDRLAPFAEREFGRMPKGHQRVTAICNWLYENIDYKRGSSNEETTADESLLKRAGVCRDFAHLGIAFCRALNIPARFVSCYAYGLEPCDFHAVFEAYLSGRSDLPLHGGRVPSWLANRMTRLGVVISEAIVLEYGREELLRRLAHPFWFQSFGAVMGMDWHSSGITTSVLGASKRGWRRSLTNSASTSAEDAAGIRAGRRTSSRASATVSALMARRVHGAPYRFSDPAASRLRMAERIVIPTRCQTAPSM